MPASGIADEQLSEEDYGSDAEKDDIDQDQSDADDAMHAAEIEQDLEEQMLAMAEAEAQESGDPYAELTVEQRKALFTQLLLDKNVSPFSTWEQELDKLVEDERYLGMPLIMRCACE